MSTKSKSKNKSKKPLYSTLEKEACSSEAHIDFSHVRKPIETSLFGLKQVLTLFETATEEVQNCISRECDLIYECRLCRTIFRSLANFILHKRQFCLESFNPNDSRNCPNNCKQDSYSIFEKDLDFSDKDGVRWNPNIDPSKGKKKSIHPIIQKLIERQQNIELVENAMNEDLSVTPNGSDNDHDDNKDKNGIILEKIHSSNAAVFQTVFKNESEEIEKKNFMKSEVMEIHGIFENNEAVIGSDGKICSFRTNQRNMKPYIPKGDLICTECDLKFSTKKTLSYHVKYKHNHTQIVYQCPVCKDTLANPWCVYRHLYKIHRKTSSQIKKLRALIHSSAIVQNRDLIKKKSHDVQIKNNDEDNQWLGNLEEDNDLQMCGGCGRRFERKAALHSHSAMCVKRIAICNSMKGNNGKKKESDERENKSNILKSDEASRDPPELSGSAKRKPLCLRTYKSAVKTVSYVENSVAAQDDVGSVDHEEVFIKVDFTKQKVEDNNKSDSTTVDCIEESMLKVESEELRSNSCMPDYETNQVDVLEGPENVVSIDLTTEETCNLRSNEILFIDIDDIPDSATIVLPRNATGEEEGVNSICNGSDSDILPRMKSYEEEIKSNFCQTIVNPDQSLTDLYSLHNTDSSASELFKTECSLEMVDQLSEEKFSDEGGGIYENDCSDTEQFQPLPQGSNVESEQEAIISSSLPVNSKTGKRKRSYSLHFHKKKVLSHLHIDKDILSREGTFVSKISSYVNKQKLLCKPCSIKFPSFSQLLWHMSYHFSWYRFQCSKCSFVSFNKYECIHHAYNVHRIPHNSMQSIVLPIPSWKTLSMAREFTVIDEKLPKPAVNGENMLGSQISPLSFRNRHSLKNTNCSGWIEKSTVTELGKTIEESDDSKDRIKCKDDLMLLKFGNPIDVVECAGNNDIIGNLSVMNEQSVNGDVPSCDKPPADSKKTSKKSIMKLVIGSDEGISKKCNKKSMVNIRPIRNRIKSAKTTHNDFIYDLNKVFTPNKAIKATSSKQTSKDVTHHKLICVYSKVKANKN